MAPTEDEGTDAGSAYLQIPDVLTRDRTNVGTDDEHVLHHDHAPLFLQNALGLTALAAGLVMMPGGIINGLMAPITGKLFDKFGPRVLIIPGLALLSIAIFLFSRIDASWTGGYVIFLHVMMMIGISMVMMPAQTTALNQLPRLLYPHGTAIMNTLQSR